MLLVFVLGVIITSAYGQIAQTCTTLSTLHVGPNFLKVCCQFDEIWAAELEQTLESATIAFQPVYNWAVINSLSKTFDRSNITVDNLQLIPLREQSGFKKYRYYVICLRKVDQAETCPYSCTLVRICDCECQAQNQWLLVNLATDAVRDSLYFTYRYDPFVQRGGDLASLKYYRTTNQNGNQSFKKISVRTAFWTNQDQAMRCAPQWASSVLQQQQVINDGQCQPFYTSADSTGDRQEEQISRPVSLYGLYFAGVIQMDTSNIKMQLQSRFQRQVLLSDITVVDFPPKQIDLTDDMVFNATFKYPTTNAIGSTSGAPYLSDTEILVTCTRINENFTLTSTASAMKQMRKTYFICIGVLVTLYFTIVK